MQCEWPYEHKNGRSLASLRTYACKCMLYISRLHIMPHELIAWKVLDLKKKSNIIKLVIDY